MWREINLFISKLIGIKSRIIPICIQIIKIQLESNSKFDFLSRIEFFSPLNITSRRKYNILIYFEKIFECDLNKKMYNEEEFQNY